MKAISEGEYKSQDEWDLANLRHLELKNDYDDLIKNHNTLLEGLGTEGGEYETKYNLYKEKLIEHNNALFEIQGRNKKGRFITDKSLGFLIARSIGKKGIQGISFFQKPLMLGLKQFGNEMLGAVKQDIINGLTTVQ